MNKYLIYGAFSVFLLGCVYNNDEGLLNLLNNETQLWEKAVTYLTPIEKDKWLEKQNHIDEKIALGHDLFIDVRLSKNQDISCNTCHNLNTFGVDNKTLSEGHGGVKEKRNTPSVFNAVLHFAQFWDARTATLGEQAVLPILNPDEMAIPSEEFLVNRLANDHDYKTRFESLYSKQKPAISLTNIADALAAFESTLVSPSRVDDYLLGDYDALTELEKEGLNKFIDLGCSPCHSGQAFGGQMMHRFGLQGYYWDVTKSQLTDQGRFTITANEEDKYVFKVPSLRNVARTYPYFHDGSVQELEKAVEVMAALQLNYNIEKQETEAIVAFLNALTGY